MDSYKLNIYKPDSRDERIATFSSSKPFQQLSVGDMLKPSPSVPISNGIHIDCIEHSIDEPPRQGGLNDGIRHEIHVYTRKSHR